MIETALAPRRVIAPEGLTLDAILAQHFPDPILKSHAVVMVDGAVVPTAAHAGYRCEAGDNVQVALIPAGGGAKKVLRTVLTVAVVVAAAWIALPGGAVAGALGGFGATLSSAAFTLAANFAINSLLPPPGISSARTEVDPTYTLSGTRNQARPREPLPVIMGRHRFTPDMITEQYQDVVGDDTHLRFGVCVGIGNYSVDDIRIGSTPIESFGNIKVQRSLTVDAAPQTLFPGDVTQTAVGINLTTTDWRSRVTAADAEDIDIILDFPRGLGQTDKKGNAVTATVTIEARYREVTTTEDAPWRDIAVDNGADADAAVEDFEILNRRGYWTNGGFSGLSGFYDNLANVGGAALSRTYSRRDFKPFSRKIRLSVPPGKQYEISVRRTGLRDDDVAVANDVSWRSLNTWSARDIAPDPRFATLWFQIPATDELSGFIDTLNARVSKIIPILDVNDPVNFDPALVTATNWAVRTGTSQNPADIYLDAIRGQHTDNPTPDDEINWASVAAFWKWCHVQNYTFNLPILQTLSRGEVEQMICAAGRGRPYRFGREKRITIDRPRTEGAKQFLTGENARNFNFLRNFANPVHGLRIRFSNGDNDNNEDEMTVYADGYSAANATIFESTSLPGETDPDQIYAKGYYILQTALRANLTGSCEMDIEADTLQLGDLVRLTAPTLNRAVTTSRALMVDGPQIVLSQSVEMDPSLNYVLRHRRVVTVDGIGQLDCDGLYPIENRPSGDEVTLSAPLPAGVSITPDDVLIIGVAGEDSFEGLVKGITPTGPYQADIEFVSYLPERLTVPNIPVHIPAIVKAFTAPPTPIFVSHSITSDFVTVNFDVPPAPSAGVAAFRAAWRFTPDEGETETWNVIVDVPPGVRSVSFPARFPSDHYDLRIASIDFDGVSSVPLLVQNMSEDSFVPAPQGVTATSFVRTNDSGVHIPIVEMSFEAVDTEILETFVVESRIANAGQEYSFAHQVTSEQTVFDIASLVPGETYDFRFYWRSIHGSVTPEENRPEIFSVTVPATLIAQDSVLIGGLPVGSIVDLLDEETGIPAIIRTAETQRRIGLELARANGVLSAAETFASRNPDFSNGSTGWRSKRSLVQVAERHPSFDVGRAKEQSDFSLSTTDEYQQALNVAKILNEHNSKQEDKL